MRQSLFKHSVSALKRLPIPEDALFLDVGCGSGDLIIRLTAEMDGKAIAIDIDEEQLSELRGKVKKLGLMERIQVINDNFLDLDFKPGTFDVIWAEGALYHIGLEYSMKKCQELLKEGGFLVVHDSILVFLPFYENSCEYGFIKYSRLNIPPDLWPEHYYKPIMERLTDDEFMINMTALESKEREMLKRQAENVLGNPRKYETDFFILRKKKK